MDINIKGDDVRTKAATFQSVGTEKYNEMKNYLANVINQELPELWRGQGSEAYIRRFNELEPSFNAIRTLIEDVAAGLVKNAEFYEEADQKAANANSRF